MLALAGMLGETESTILTFGPASVDSLVVSALALLNTILTATTIYLSLSFMMRSIISVGLSLPVI